MKDNSFSNRPLTPFYERGWDKDQLFKVKNNICFSEGSIVQLHYDDGSTAPLFKLIKGHCEYSLANKQAGAFEDLDNLEPIDGK